MDEQSSFEPQAVLAPKRAGWNRLRIILPVVALIGAVWFGISGRGPAASPGDEHDKAIAQASNPASPADTTQPPGQDTGGYPSTVLGIEVRTLANLDRSNTGKEQVVAVAGWYLAWPSLGCPTSRGVVPGFVAELGVDADRRTFCDRSGLLVAIPNPAGSSTNVGGANDHPYGSSAPQPLPVIVTPGVVLPAELSGTGAASAPGQVILIGRLVERSQPTDQASSGAQLLVDRVAWADGIGQAQTTSILPKLLDRGPQLALRPRDALANTVIGPTGPILLETLVDPATLAVVDPWAAALIADTSPHSERIWYRLALGIDAAHGLPRWVVIDDTLGAVIGTGFVGEQTVTIVTGAGDDQGGQQGPRLPADGVNVLTGG
jgi:hypothetical protein